MLRSLLRPVSAARQAVGARAYGAAVAASNAAPVTLPGAVYPLPPKVYADPWYYDAHTPKVSHGPHEFYYRVEQLSTLPPTFGPTAVAIVTDKASPIRLFGNPSGKISLLDIENTWFNLPQDVRYAVALRAKLMASEDWKSLTDNEKRLIYYTSYGPFKTPEEISMAGNLVNWGVVLGFVVASVIILDNVPNGEKQKPDGHTEEVAARRDREWREYQEKYYEDVNPPKPEWKDRYLIDVHAFPPKK